MGYWGVPCPRCEKILSLVYGENDEYPKLICRNKECNKYGK